MFSSRILKASSFGLAALFVALPAFAQKNTPHAALSQTAPERPASASPDVTIAGLYQIEYYDLSGSNFAYHCLDFYRDKKVGLGKNSGYFYATDEPSYHGSWVIQGNNLRFYGGYDEVSSGQYYLQYLVHQARIDKNGVTGYGFDGFTSELQTLQDGTFTLTSASSANCTGSGG